MFAFLRQIKNIVEIWYDGLKFQTFQNPNSKSYIERTLLLVVFVRLETPKQTNLW